MIECECGNEMEYVYTKDEVKELIGNSKNIIQEMKLNTLVRCSCGIARSMTRKEIFKEFKDRKKK